MRAVVQLGAVALTATFVVAGFGVAPGVARAFPNLRFSVPNWLEVTTPSGRRLSCITCHSEVEGGSACPERDGCLNDFGEDYADNFPPFSWSSIAEDDSDGDGYSNAEELQDLTASWMSGEPRPGFLASVTNPGDAGDTPGVDADGDGFCIVGRDTSGDGVCTGTEILTTAFDCDDGNTAVNSGVLEEVCTNELDNDCDGLLPRDELGCASIRDDDADGFCPEGVDVDGDGICTADGEPRTEIQDCDDRDPRVFLGAAEDCFDGIDNDCDDDVDLADAFCSGAMDRDGDGWCPIGRDVTGDGDCLDAGDVRTESRATSDCDDLAAGTNPGAAEVCGDGANTDCDASLLDEMDSDCTDFVDRDGDGVCPGGRDVSGDGDCLDAGEDTADVDCDDDDAERSPDLPENCLPACVAKDEDCDGLADLDDPGCAGFIDDDGDGWCPMGADRIGLRNPCDGPGPPVFMPDGLCLNDGEALTEGGDCNDDAAEERPDGVECDETACFCTDDLDNDCSGRRDARDPACADYTDRDRDGWCVVGPDLDLDGECTSPGEHEASEGDLAPFDPVIYPGAPEHCFDGKDNDQDGATDDADVACTGDRDADGDGYCPVGQDDNGDGDCLDAGESTTVSDCDDDDPNVNPGAAEDTRALCTDLRDTDCDTDIDLGDGGAGLYDADADCDVLLDRDGDGACPSGIDWNGDGDCVDVDEAGGLDCDDDDPNVRQGVPERCGNLVDDDCDEEIDELGDCLCEVDDDCIDPSDACLIGTCEPSRLCTFAPRDTPECAVDAGVGGGGGGGRGCTVGSLSPAAGVGGALLAVAPFFVRVRRRRGRGRELRG